MKNKTSHYDYEHINNAFVINKFENYLKYDWQRYDLETDMYVKWAFVIRIFTIDYDKAHYCHKSERSGIRTEVSFYQLV